MCKWKYFFEHNKNVIKLHFCCVPKILPFTHLYTKQYWNKFATDKIISEFMFVKKLYEQIRREKDRVNRKEIELLCMKRHKKEANNDVMKH